MDANLSAKIILGVFIAVAVFMILALMIKNYRQKEEEKALERTQNKYDHEEFLERKKKEIPVYIGGNYAPIERNKKHPSYQENLEGERKRAEKRREEERKDQERRRRDNDLANDYDDSLFETNRRSSTSSYAYDTSSNHHSSHSSHSWGGDSGSSSSSSSSCSSSSDSSGGGCD